MLVRRKFLKTLGGLFVPAIARAQFTYTDIPWLASATSTPPNGLLNNLAHFFQFQETAAPFSDQGSGTNFPLSYTNAGQDFTRVSGFVSPFAGHYNGASGFNFAGTLTTASADFAGTSAQTKSCSFLIWLNTSNSQPQISRTPGIIGTWDDDSNTAKECWIVVMDAANTANLKIFSRDSSGTLSSITTIAVSNNAWHMLTGGWDAGNNTLWVSVDNGAKSTAAQTSLRNTVGGATFQIANLASAAQRECFMSWSDVGIWSDRALSTTDLSELWNGGSGLPFANYTH